MSRSVRVSTNIYYDRSAGSVVEYHPDRVHILQARRLTGHRSSPFTSTGTGLGDITPPVHLNPDGFGYGSAGWLAGGGLSAVGSAFFRVPHGGGGQGAAGSTKYDTVALGLWRVLSFAYGLDS